MAQHDPWISLQSFNEFASFINPEVLISSTAPPDASEWTEPNQIELAKTNETKQRNTIWSSVWDFPLMMSAILSPKSKSNGSACIMRCHESISGQSTVSLKQKQYQPMLMPYPHQREAFQRPPKAGSLPPTSCWMLELPRVCFLWGCAELGPQSDAQFEAPMSQMSGPFSWVLLSTSSCHLSCLSCHLLCPFCRLGCWGQSDAIIQVSQCNRTFRNRFQNGINQATHTAT